MLTGVTTVDLIGVAACILQMVAGQNGTMVIEDVAARLDLQPRGGHWNAGVTMLRSNDLIQTGQAGFNLGAVLAGLSTSAPGKAATHD